MLSCALSGHGDKSLVFLHGFGGSRGLWRWQIEEISPVARCLAIDLPGHGESAWFSSTLSGMAQEVIAVLRAQGLGRSYFAASSFGGLVALKVLEIAPDMVSSLTLTGSLPRFTQDNDFPAGLNVQRIRKLAGQFEGDVAGVLDMFFRSLFTMKERASGQYSRIRDLRQGLPLPRREALLAFLDMLETEDLRPLFRTSNVPIQLIQGDQDLICPLVAIEKVREMRPASRIDIIRDSGHFPFLSYPSEFSRHLREFAGV